MTEKFIETKLLRFVKENKGKAYKWISPGNSGVPDRIVIFPEGLIYFIELKKPGGKTRALQDVKIKELKELGCRVKVISTVEEIKEFIKEVQNETTRLSK